MKRATLCLGLAVASFTLGAQEVSLNLATNATAAKYSDFSSSFYEQATGDFTLPFGATSELAGSGFVKVLAAFPSETNPSFNYGLEKLRYEMAAKKPFDAMNTFVLDAGRFDFSDPSGNILSSPADGFAFQFKYTGLEVAFRSAYTGFLFLKDSSITPIAMSLADKARISAGTELTGSPRVIVQADLSLPKLFDQSVDFSILSQSDLNPSSSLVDAGTSTYQIDKGGRLNTQYFELESSGGVAVVNYDAFFAYGTGTTLTWTADDSSSSGNSYQYKPISSFLTGAKLSMPLDLPKPLSASSAGARLLYATGDKEASSAVEGNTSATYTAFTPMTSPTLGVVFSPSLSNIVLGEASFSTSPTLGAYTVVTTAKVLTFFRPTSGPISEAGIDSESTSPYLGSEVDLSLSTGIFSDLGLSFVSGVFVPGSAFASTYQSVQFSAGITATITM
jgi:hypothetical protein